MSSPLRDWLKRQFQDRGFHPAWILIGVVATMVIGAIVWLPAEWIAKSDYKRLPPALRAPSAPPGGSLPREGGPAGMPAIDQAPLEVPKIIRVDSTFARPTVLLARSVRVSHHA